jgi:hypothetical protein
LGKNRSPHPKDDRTTKALSIIAIILSVISLALASRTYFLSERPYLGITKVEESYEKKDSEITRIRWAIKLKNTGAMPASGKVSKRKVVVNNGKEDFEVPLTVVPDASLFVMPGGEGILYGDVPDNEHVPLKDILSGKATIIDSMRVSYEPSSAAWWKSNYHYEAKLKYLGGPGPDKYFSMTVVDAN